MHRLAVIEPDRGRSPGVGVETHPQKGPSLVNKVHVKWQILITITLSSMVHGLAECRRTAFAHIGDGICCAISAPIFINLSQSLKLIGFCDH
jgi:hypothetical protein